MLSLSHLQGPFIHYVSTQEWVGGSKQPKNIKTFKESILTLMRLHFLLEPVCSKKRQKSSWPVTGLGNRGSVEVLNDIKLFLTANWLYLVVLLKLNEVIQCILLPHDLPQIVVPIFLVCLLLSLKLKYVLQYFLSILNQRNKAGYKSSFQPQYHSYN